MIPQQQLVERHFEQHDGIVGGLAYTGIGPIDRGAIERVDLSLHDFCMIVASNFFAELSPQFGAFVDGKGAILFLISC